MIIESSDAASLRTKNSYIGIIGICKRRNIDISYIQETHNESKETFEDANYIVIFGRNELYRNEENNRNPSREDGVAMAITKAIISLVKTVNKIDGAQRG